MLRPILSVAVLAGLGMAGGASAQGWDDESYYERPGGPDVTVTTRRVEIYRDPAAGEHYDDALDEADVMVTTRRVDIYRNAPVSHDAYRPRRVAVEEDNDFPDEPDISVTTRRVEVYRDGRLARRVYRPRFYGRPLDCGTYRYWDGDYCVDARSEPPLK